MICSSYFPVRSYFCSAVVCIYVEDRHGWGGDVCYLQSVEEVEVLLGLSNDSCGVVAGCQISSQISPQKFSGVDPLYDRTTCAQWKTMFLVDLPPVSDHICGCVGSPPHFLKLTYLHHRWGIQKQCHQGYFIVRLLMNFAEQGSVSSMDNDGLSMPL